MTLLEQAHEAAISDWGNVGRLGFEAGLSFLLSQGYKILGPKATEGMSIAGQLVPMGIGGSPPSWQRIWDAMHDAAPSFPEDPVTPVATAYDYEAMFRTVDKRLQEREAELQKWRLIALNQTAQNRRVGSWLSAALDDPNVCEEMKADVRAWFDSSFASPEGPVTDEEEMVERVARAIYESTPPEDEEESFDDAEPEFKELCRINARAALAAMKEPTHD